MAVSFRWAVIKSNTPPAPVLQVTLSAGYYERTVQGLYDTGADFTNLDPIWKQKLRVRQNACIPWTMTVANGQVVTAELTVLGATLDGHTFRMPVVFLPNVPTDLFGRVGIFDQFKVELDPSTQMTTVSWIGSTGTPWTDVIETLWRQQLQTLGVQQNPT